MSENWRHSRTTVAAAAKHEVEEKCDLLATTYPPVHLRSACSCILTAQPIPTTVYTTTSTVAVTTAPTPSGCTHPASIVKNGDFESGLAPWTIDSTTPPYPEYSQYESFGVKAPSYNSANTFTVGDKAASSYFELDLSQTLQVCTGQKYNFRAEFYMTDSHDAPTKQTYLQVFVDGKQIASSNFDQGQGSPIVWFPLTGIFTAVSNTPKLTAKFVATDYLGVTWGFDKVTVTPA